MQDSVRDDVTAIMALKARYCRTLDTKDWDGFASCLAEDFTGQYDGMPRRSKDDQTVAMVAGRQSVAEGTAANLQAVPTSHAVYAPEIEMIDATHAKGVWGMRDYLRFDTCIFVGYGHYHEDYVKSDGVWRIQRTHLTRLFVEEDWR